MTHKALFYNQNVTNMEETKTKITIGKYEVLTSGQFLGFSDQENILEISQGRSSIKIRFVFREDDSGKTELGSEIISNTDLRVVFNNFNDSLGMGNTEPIRLGNFNGKELFFSYRISSLKDKTLRKVEYTFYGK